MIRRKIIAATLLLFFTGFSLSSYAAEVKYPDYASEFLGPDKHETFNRKMFDFNYGLNKFAIKPVHILWASVMPQYPLARRLPM